MMKIRNLLVFVWCAIWNGVPFHLWQRAWYLVMEDHKAQVHKAIWELKKQGEIYEDKNGRLWPK